LKMKRDFSTFILYALGFMLVWEWIRPLEQLTTTDNIETFIIFLLLCFTAAFMKLRWFWQWIIKLWFIFFSINRLYYDEGYFQFQWLISFLGDLEGNLLQVWERNWLDLSDGFRTLLFFIVLWLMAYLVHYWLLNRQKIFTFFLITLIYITVLDTFTAYNAKTAIIRTVVAGFAVMGMLTYYRILVKENVSEYSAVTRKWMKPLALMIIASVLIGIAAPKLDPIWPDPVPHLTAAGNKGGEDGNSGISRVGYGSNDEQLGGPFLADDRVVFRSEANGKNYWKVETKDVYTGKGWIPSGSTPITISSEELIPVFSIPKTVETRDETATLYLSMDYPHLIYPAGIQRVQFSQNYRLEIDTTKEKVSIKDAFAESVLPDSYTMEFKVPKYKASDLMQTTLVDPEQVGAEFIERYTKLPEELPERVKQLAELITAGKTNWFDKAKAVEQYFGSTQFTYDQKNVAIPGENDDYVDQFLFDTKTGYCDNFSSSMAVLLRTLGIPTRWVKGYTGGDFVEYSEKDPSRSIYEITNNNAHSWVEVYFPNQGWVPFEPTKGYTNEVSISYINENSVPTTPETTPPPVQKPEQEEAAATNNKPDSKESINFEGIWLGVKSFLGDKWKMILLMVVAGGGAIGLLYRIRGKWVPYLYLLRFRWRKKDENIGEAYLILLKQLDRYGIKRKENQTLRNYAVYIDTFFSTREMTKLTARYEQYLYHEQIPQGSWEDSRKLWENLIKKTIA
jgi:transglutaminase-like putative cysteine protease